MRFLPLLLLSLACVRGESVRYELRGRLVPATRASVWLHGATAPFEDSTLADGDGRFRFRAVEPGTYTLGAFVPGRGEMRRTIEVGPSQADGKKRIELTVDLRDSQFESRDSLRRAALVSAKDLAIPDQARHEYEEAQKKLTRRDADGAAAHLKRAVELAPQFSAAWNNLGTIAYQSREYPRAEGYFRKALDSDPDSFMALVNLGGVLLNLGKFEEALEYNLYAALTRPTDALANSQLGMNYFQLDKLDQGQKYLTVARKLDPAHFSHPQLVLSQIALRRHDRAGAAAELADFLQQHPDSPEAPRIKENIAKLRAAQGPAEAFAASGMARSYQESKDEASIGSGRHARIRLQRAADGTWKEVRDAQAAAFGFSAACLNCHAARTDGHTAAMNCASCHASGPPGQAACLRCHVEAAGPLSAHGASAPAEDPFELNSAGYRLLQSRCYQSSAGKLTCTTCHPAHTFARDDAGYRAVCRNCHPATHNGAALDCARCHMPKHAARDAGQLMVTDHRIQRPL